MNYKNFRFSINGNSIDVAVDYDKEMHAYDRRVYGEEDLVPVEYYCLNHPEWDVEVVFLRGEGRCGDGRPQTLNIQKILDEGARWVTEMEEMENI